MKWNVLLKRIGIQISVKVWISHRRVDLNAAVFVKRWIPEAWNTTSQPFRQMQDHSRDSQLDSYITVPDLLYVSVSAVESLKAPVFYKLRTCDVILFRFLTWYMADLQSLLIFISLTNLKACHVTAVQLWAELFIKHKSGKSSLVNGPQSFSPRLLHLKPKLNLSFSVSLSGRLVLPFISVFLRGVQSYIIPGTP